ncbi:NAD(P)-binding protein [Lentithecium fluviatile CBS 122367]|uniref:NAD(P)-binding protein n=1 Tax=Lentithecium fluviatile CBS 122367 TaxID=1168545 RepID=A0A6G1IE91_9PLEO|nr:NAD(P)-binding protein [Lentithecium fluviatile CBS 122367]
MARRRLLVTGASTLIGSHILNQLLAYDVSVRAVVGSSEEMQTLRQQYPPSTHPRLEFAIVPHKESGIPGAFESALHDYPEPFDTIIHTVAADPAEDADCLARLVNLETESSINLLRSIKAITSRVHRVVVITSLSPFARWLVDPQMEPLSPGGYYNQQRVAEIDSEYVLATSQASDNIIHDALWKWMRDVHARFDLVYLTAPSVYGPSIRPLENSSDLQEANRRVWNICSNAGDRMSSPPYGIDYFTDVRDFAFASVQAAFTPHAGNRRFVISAGTMPSGTVIADFLISRFPELGSRVRSYGSPPRRPPSGGSPLDVVDTHLAATVLGLVQYRRVEDTLTDLAQQILELHRRKEWRSVIQS